MNLKQTLKSLKLHESTISMLLGAVVIVVAGVLLINYFSGRGGETVPPLEIEEEISSQTTHTVAEGEDLWKIAEKYYGNGEDWEKIAQANNITNPNQIEAGQTLSIPESEQPQIAEATPVLNSPTITQAADETPTSTPIITPTLQPEAPVGNTHTVQSGESLWTIAERYYKSGYNWIDIARENNLSEPGVISEGQKLTIPSVESKTATTDDQESATDSISGNTYTVQSGDSLWTIAVRAYGDGYRWVEIAKENSLLNPSIIHPGNTLNLPR